MHNVRALLSTTAALCVLTVASAAPPANAAAPPVQFGTIQYNPSGADTRTPRQLDREWVTITNHGDAARALTGWTVRDKQGHTYQFSSFTLAPHRSVKLHTGSGRDSKADVYWGSGNFIWNNTGDTATLKDAGGKRQDSCSWGDGSGVIPC